MSIRGDMSYHNKDHYGKSTVNVILDSENLECISSNISKKTIIPTLVTFI